MIIERKSNQITLTLSELMKLSTGKVIRLNKGRVKTVPPMKFGNLSDLLTYCNITPREFANRTGYDYRAVLSWVKGKDIPSKIKDNLLTITVSRSPSINGYYERIYLCGSKIKFNFNGKELYLDEKKGLIGDKPRKLSCDIWKNSSMTQNDCFLKK